MKKMFCTKLQKGFCTDQQKTFCTGRYIICSANEGLDVVSKALRIKRFAKSSKINLVFNKL
jgi:hypothetical protein